MKAASALLATNPHSEAAASFRSGPVISSSKPQRHRQRTEREGDGAFVSAAILGLFSRLFTRSLSVLTRLSLRS